MVEQPQPRTAAAVPVAGNCGGVGATMDDGCYVKQRESGTLTGDYHASLAGCTCRTGGARQRHHHRAPYDSALCENFLKVTRAAPGIEPGTSRRLSNAWVMESHDRLVQELWTFFLKFVQIRYSLAG